MRKLAKRGLQCGEEERRTRRKPEEEALRPVSADMGHGSWPPRRGPARWGPARQDTPGPESRHSDRVLSEARVQAALQAGRTRPALGADPPPRKPEVLTQHTHHRVSPPWALRAERSLHAPPAVMLTKTKTASGSGQV